MVQVDRLTRCIPIAEADLWLEVENLQVLDHVVSLLYHIDYEAITVTIFFIFLLIFHLRREAVHLLVRQIRKDVTDLRVDRIHGFALEQSRHAAGVVITKSGDQNGVKPVEMSTEIPEASFPAESSVNEQVESVDAEKS